jgi:ectoine hydroxylase-related dioxygenase (phytanoyl-CoA dioxygenase family)
MNAILTPEQIFNYRANGYLAPLNGLSSDEVKEYRNELTRTEKHLGGSLMEIDKKYRGNLHLMCQWVDKIARHPAIVGVIEDLLGPNILLYTSRFFIKEPKSETIAAWHQDSTYFGLKPFDHVTAWVALSDVTAESGPLEFAVGSHIRGQLIQKSGVVKNSVNTGGQIIVDWFDQSRIDHALLRPGQFSLHHTCVVHQSAPNKSNERRIGLALSYIPTRTRYIGSRKMPACLVRGQDLHQHFDLQPAPQEDFGKAEMLRHDTSFKLYLESFYEQLDASEKNMPPDIAAIIMN